MSAIRVILLCACALLVLTGCGEAGIIGATVITEGEHTIGRGEQVRGELVILDGVVRLERGARISGTVHVLGGRTDIDSAIGGDLSVLNGEVSLQPHADIAGEVIAAGGTLEQAPGAAVGGAGIERIAEGVPLGPAWSERSLATRLQTLLLTGAVPMLVAYVVLILRPRPLLRISDAMTSHPLVSGSLGLLASVVGLVLAVFMAFTVVLIPAALLLLVLVGLVAVLGWLALGLAVGQTVARWSGWRIPLATAGLLGTGLLALLAHLIEFVPLVGSLVPVVALVTGFGAALLTRLGRRQFIPQSYEADPDHPPSATQVR